MRILSLEPLKCSWLRRNSMFLKLFFHGFGLGLHVNQVSGNSVFQRPGNFSYKKNVKFCYFLPVNRWCYTTHGWKGSLDAALWNLCATEIKSNGALQLRMPCFLAVVGATAHMGTWGVVWWRPLRPAYHSNLVGSGATVDELFHKNSTMGYMPTESLGVSVSREALMKNSQILVLSFHFCQSLGGVTPHMSMSGLVWCDSLSPE